MNRPSQSDALSLHAPVIRNENRFRAPKSADLMICILIVKKL